MIFVFQNLKHHEHLKSCPIKHVISVYSWYTVKYKSTFRLGLPAFFVIGKSSYGNIHLSKDRLVLIILAVFDAFPLWWGLWNWSTWLFSDWIRLCIIQIDNVHVWVLFDELISEEGDLTSVFLSDLKRTVKGFILTLGGWVSSLWVVHNLPFFIN